MCFEKKKKEKTKSWYTGPTAPKIKTPKKHKKLKRFLIILGILVVLGIAAYLIFHTVSELSPWDPFDTDEETMLSLAPVNEDQAKAIDALPQYSEDDTWAFYVYMVGADLESSGLDELSGLTKYLVAQEAAEISAEDSAKSISYINTFVDEVNSQGVELPQILYQPTVNVSSGSSYSSNDSYDPDTKGYASTDLEEMATSDIPENLKIVIQTGGAKRWQNSLINPNRSQRFVIDSESYMDKVYDAPIVNMSTPESLADFITYCTENYKADHSVLIFWDHGGAISGYGCDEIYGSILSLEDIHNALEMSVGSEEPYFEIIGFDACLMSCLEAAHELYPYAKYLSASEETEPGDGWAYSGIISSLVDNPAENGAQLGKAIADTFVESCITSFAEYGYVTPATFSLIDLSKVEAVYDAYSAFCSAALKKAAEKPSFLSSLSRAAQSSIAYAGEVYRVYNMIDLGLFVQEASSELPEASKAVLSAIDECVMYVRSSSYLCDSTGLSIYFPARIEGIGGIKMFLKYINDVSDDKNINALYYYKLAGCLNDDLREYTDSEGYDEIKNIDYTIMNGIGGIEVNCSGDGNMSLKLGSNLLDLTQAVRFGLAKYDPDTNDIIYYGEDGYAFLDDDGTISTNFTGTWVSLDGNPLPLEVVSETGDDITFRTSIDYNGLDAWLMVGFDAETGEYSILGVREVLNEAGTLNRSLLPLKDNSYITINYESGNLLSNASDIETKTVVYTSKTKLEDLTLKDGSYIEYIVVEDLRSDVYNTAVATFDINNGKISNQAIDPDIYSYEKG